MQYPHTPAQADEAELRSQVLNNVLGVSTYLVSVTDAAELLAGLAQKVVEALPSIQAGLLWVYDRQPDTLRIASVHGLELGEHSEAVVKLRLRPGEGLAGTTFRRGDSIFFEGRTRYREMSVNISQQNLPVLEILFEALPRDMTAVLLPLRMGNETLGVLELLNFGQKPPLRRQDLQVLQMFAHLAATAVKNAQLQAHQRRLGAIDAIGTAITTAASLEEMMRDVLDVILSEDVVNATAGALLLYDPARAMLTFGAQRGLSESYVERYRETPVGDSACDEAVRYCQSIRRPLIPEGQEVELIAAGLGSCVYLPLLAGGTVVGVVCVYGDANFHERVDVKALTTMGSLIGFAIANVSLYEASDIERRRLSAVINGIAEGVALCDRMGRLVLVNETARALLSLETVPYQQTLSEMADFHAIRDLDGNPMPVERLPLARALSGEVFHDYRVLQRGASGQNTVMSFSGAPVIREDHSVEGAVVVFRDITANQTIERAKDDFLAVAAHELRAPLAAVRSYTDLLVRRAAARSTEEESPDLRGLTLLAQQVTHMLHMVENLLDVSRIEADQFRLECNPINLVALVEQVLEQQRPSSGERAFSLQTTHNELTVTCDQLRIRQVLTNLISNAVRYSPSGTPVRIALDVQTAEDLTKRFPDFASARATTSMADGVPMVLVAVEDRGYGISEEQRGRLFRRYERGNQNRRGEGLGLGLYLSHEFVARHGGVLWVESRVNEGSTFYVALPVWGNLLD
ncbi:MAG: ATP-binding protein [Roseiflexaceae bacterium]